MEDFPEPSDCGTNDCTMFSNSNGLLLRPVAAGEWGHGLPYAPDGWPNPGDKWIWKVGRRKSPTGYWVDRYLYLPESLQKAMGKRAMCFPSRARVREFLKAEFPDANIDAFFSLFQWKVPCVYHHQTKGEMSHLRNGTASPGTPNSTSDHDSLQAAPIPETDQKPFCIPSLHNFASLKLENVIKHVLQSLRESQEVEYKIAERKLNDQKEFLLSLYQQLDSERSEIEKRKSATPDGGLEDLCAGALSTLDQIKGELVKVRQMRQVGKGFGRTQKDVLKENFGLAVED